MTDLAPKPHVLLGNLFTANDGMWVGFLGEGSSSNVNSGLVVPNEESCQSTKTQIRKVIIKRMLCDLRLMVEVQEQRLC